MSSRRKKHEEWEEKKIGFEELDPEYGKVFMLFFADYRLF